MYSVGEALVGVAVHMYSSYQGAWNHTSRKSLPFTVMSITKMDQKGEKSEIAPGKT